MVSRRKGGREGGSKEKYHRKEKNRKRQREADTGDFDSDCNCRLNGKTVPGIDYSNEKTFDLHPVFALPEMTTPRDISAMRLLGALAPSLYFLMSPLFAHMAHL